MKEVLARVGERWRAWRAARYTEIDLARDFGRYPAGRTRQDGPQSGEAFREDCLGPALRGHWRVVVSLDGAAGYGSSFLEEAFGGLTARDGYSADEVARRLRLRTRDASLIMEISGYVGRPIRRAWGTLHSGV